MRHKCRVKQVKVQRVVFDINSYLIIGLNFNFYSMKCTFKNRNEISLSSSMKKQFKKKEVELSFNESKSSQMSEVFPLISEWEALSINLSDNKKKTIVTDIRNIEFTFLRSLFLENNSIESLEEFSKIWIPSIEVLSFSQNHIVKMKQLRKSPLNNLQELSINENNIVDSECLSDFSSKQLSLIDVQFSNKQQMEDIRQLCKMSSQTLRSIGSFVIMEVLKNQKRMVQRELKNALKRRYDLIHIYEKV